MLLQLIQQNVYLLIKDLFISSDIYATPRLPVNESTKITSPRNNPHERKHKTSTFAKICTTIPDSRYMRPNRMDGNCP